MLTPSAPGAAADALRIGGLARLSSVDWPGQLVATVFTQGCPWDCPYCHNPHLLPGAPTSGPGASPALVPWRVVASFLESRIGLLDAVVFSGGEPLAQPALPAAIADVRALGFQVALHTGGAFPERFAEILPLLAWVGFDAKAPFAEYERTTGVAGSGGRACESLQRLLASGASYEVRTTVHPDLLGEAQLLLLADELRDLGVARWVLQPFRADGVRRGVLSLATRPTLPPHLLSRLAEGFSAFEVRA